MGPHRYAERWTRIWETSVCNTCYNSKWDGIVPGILVLSAAMAPKSSMAGLVVAGFGLCCVAAYVDIPRARRIAKAARQACERVMAGLTVKESGSRSKTARIQGRQGV